MKKSFRIFPRMDIKGDKLVKTIRLEGVKVVGDPKFFVKKYYEEGADEIFLNDAVASLYGRNSLFDVIKEISKEEYQYYNVFIITTSWFTKTKKGQQSIFHSHKNSFYSGVYYFGDYSEDSAPIAFENPLTPFMDFYMYPSGEWTIKNSQTWEITPRKNLLILFPSYIRHTIMRSEDDGVRESLAFNIVPIGEYGASDSTYNTKWVR